MNRCIAALSLLLVVLFSGNASAQSSRVVIDEFAVSRWVTENMEALKLPSIAVGIVGPKENYYLESFGPADLDHQFLVGSLTKSVTAMAVMLLVEDGKVELAKPASSWVTGVPEAVTVEHLLHQTSGLHRADGGSGWTDLDLSVDEMVARATFGPVGTFAYSNLNYQILGRIIEKASGKSYAAFVAERIFAPAGMKHASAEADAPEGHVIGHQYMFGFPQPFGEPAYNPATIPSGFVWMSGEDMSRWLRLFVTGGVLDGKQVIPSAVIAKLLEKPAGSDYAMGWQYRAEEPRYAKHTGATGAFTAAMAVMPEREFGVFVLTNVNSWMALAPSNVLDGLMAAVLGSAKPSVTNVEFLGRLVFGLIVALIVFTFLFELARWVGAKFPMRLSKREGIALAVTVVVNVVVVLAVTQYFETPISVVLAIQPDIGAGFLITVGLGTIRQLLTGFNKTLHQRAIEGDE